MSMTLREAIETRRSIRKYKQQPIPREDIEEMLRLTGLAPSAWNIQPWRFIVVTNAEKKRELYFAANQHPQVDSALAVVILTSDMEDAILRKGESIHPDLPKEEKQWLKENIPGILGKQTMEQRGRWGVAQTNIALAYLLLAARSMGYDSSPTYGFHPAKVRQLFNLPEYVQIVALIPIGQRAEEGQPHHRHPWERIVRYV